MMMIRQAKPQCPCHRLKCSVEQKESEILVLDEAFFWRRGITWSQVLWCEVFSLSLWVLKPLPGDCHRSLSLSCSCSCCMLLLLWYVCLVTYLSEKMTPTFPGWNMSIWKERERGKNFEPNLPHTIFLKLAKNNSINWFSCCWGRKWTVPHQNKARAHPHSSYISSIDCQVFFFLFRADGALFLFPLYPPESANFLFPTPVPDATIWMFLSDERAMCEWVEKNVTMMITSNLYTTTRTCNILSQRLKQAKATKWNDHFFDQ